MKKLLLWPLLALFGLAAKSQVAVTDTSTRIYLVRHAEKEPDGSKDPSLSKAGFARAGDLMRTLQDRNIQRIYVTQFRRSRMTADSMHLQLGIETVEYNGKDTTGDDLVKQITDHNDWGKSILVIGHSNTILRIAKRFGAKVEDSLDIPEYEYDNLVFLKFKNGKAIMVRWKYGTFSKPPGEPKAVPVDNMKAGN